MAWNIMLEKLLVQLFKELELGTVPPPDDQKAFHVKIDRFDVAVKEIEPVVYVSSIIGPLPPKNREEFLMRVMKANFLGQGTGGGAIGLTENESFLTLSFSLPYEVNYMTFKESLEEFINYLDYWTREIVKHESEAAIN